MSETTIGVNTNTKDTLKQMRSQGETIEDVVKNLLLLRKCPGCQSENLQIKRTYVFEPLYFDLECPKCGYIEERWRIPFKPWNGGKK